MKNIRERLHLISFIFRRDRDLPIILEKAEIIAKMCNFSPHEVEQITESVSEAAQCIWKNKTGKICWSLVRSPQGNGGMEITIENLAAPQRGVVSTASYEARKHGIYSWMSLRTAYKLCPEAIFLPVDYACHATPRFLKRSRRACTSSPGESRKSAWTKPFSILAWFQRQYLQLPRCLTQQDIMLAIDL